MAYEIDIIKQMMRRMQSEVNQSLHELSKMPEGRLYQLQQGERTYYYQVMGTGNKRTRKGITSNLRVVYQLARKEYLLRSMKDQSNAINHINRTAANLNLDFWQSAMQAVSGRFPAIPLGVFMFGDQYGILDSRSVSMFLEGTIHRSQRGVLVRSKSELIIADMLESLGIPYQYEVDLPYDDYHLCPDFTVIRPRDGKVIFWEHFGMTHDEEYLSKMDHKLEKYRNMNIKPWDNLMISYDQEDGSLDVGLIRAMVEGWLR